VQAWHYLEVRQAAHNKANKKGSPTRTPFCSIFHFIQSIEIAPNHKKKPAICGHFK
jgi:hypothetical protein